VNKFKLFVLESTVPLGFCYGGFSSTAGYVPGNEAQRLLRVASGVALDWLIISKERYSFLSEQLEKSEDLSSKPFGFSSGCEVNPIRSSLLSNVASPHRLPLPVPVKMPVSNFDYGWSLHPIFSMSRTIYFNFRPVFIGLLWKNCGNRMWKKCG
jgi:hypothetical protein